MLKSFSSQLLGPPPKADIMLIDLTKSYEVSLQEVGGKAFNLHKLVQMGLPVPPCIALPASLHDTLNEPKLEQLKAHLDKHIVISTGTTFAVRSSGVGEDGEVSSCAGIFESYLNVPREKILEATVSVWESLGNARSIMYGTERSVSVSSMGVVIQHMIEAQYAGVAFSVCPVEKDRRIALIEVVEGNGNSLVSGTKTPATIRVNKVTGLMRIERHGIDEIASATLETITDTLMPLIKKIETMYGIPVDIEWAVAQGKPYILQARSITA